MSAQLNPGGLDPDVVVGCFVAVLGIGMPRRYRWLIAAVLVIPRVKALD